MDVSRRTELGYVTISGCEGFVTGLSFADTGKCRSDGTIDDAFVQLEEYLSGERRKFDLRYSFNGTDFQKLVWNTLVKIPYGKAISYADEAIMIGRPGAARAVGSANGKNPIPIFIPCHRVVNANGKIGGYSSDIEIKMKLLELEGAKWITEKN